MIPRRSRAALKICWTSASFARVPAGRIATNSAKPIMALSGARSFWFSLARKARSSGESVSETLSELEGSFIAFISESMSSRLRSRCVPTARRLPSSPLSHDVAEGGCEPLSQLLLLILREHTQDSVDCLTGVDRMHRGENDVAGLGRCHRDLHRLAIANFTDENCL